MNPNQTFRLAPMSFPILALTAVVLAIPVLYGVLGLLTPAPTGPVLGLVAVFLVVCYAAVGLVFRPTSFEITPQHLNLRWPLRGREILRRDVVNARVLSRSEFREAYGWSVRIGAGGLGGSFGLLWTRSGGYLDHYVSRLDRMVLIEQKSARPLLLTPEEPEAFVAALLGGDR